MINRLQQLFKSKPRLSALIPPGYTDIHSHFLPGIDDGSKNVADTILLLAEIQKLGFSKCITTPHTISGIWENDRRSIQCNWETTKAQLPPMLRDMIIRVASEYMLDDTLLKLAAREDLLCLKDNYVLVELSYLQPPLAMAELFFELEVKGYRIILAHPERYLFFQEDLKTLEKLKAAGCKLQLNLLSVTGYYGDDVVRFADQLLANHFIDFTGSDIHHIKHIEGFARTVKIRAVNQLENAIQANEWFGV